jgi:hypothetical protein
LGPPPVRARRRESRGRPLEATVIGPSRCFAELIS